MFSEAAKLVRYEYHKMRNKWEEHPVERTLVGSLPKWVVNKSSQFLAPRVLKKIYKACLNYPAWKKINQPQFKPWLNPEQNTLPSIPISRLAMQHAESLENIDESGLIDANEDKGGNSDDENDGKN